MYKIIVITDKAIVPGLYDLKDLSGPTKSHVYITNEYKEWVGTLEWLKMFVDNCKRNNNLIISVQVVHQSKLERTDI